MHRSFYRLTGLLLCAGVAQAQTDLPAPEEAWLGQAREIAQSLPKQLLQTLTGEIQKGGPVHAIDVCQQEAPRLAKSASEASGWQIRRVSLGNRNPKATPDAWERETLEGFEQQQAAGVPAAQLERAGVVQENGQTVRRYMRALGTQGVCLSCHGSATQLAPGVAQRLQQLYPQDRATGYALGQIRGAITLRQAAD